MWDRYPTYTFVVNETENGFVIYYGDEHWIANSPEVASLVIRDCLRTESNYQVWWSDDDVG